ncbi:MAG: hypothetical protein K0Q49_1169 [Haloplasmataceae bacterium]|jgi:MinD-like ATPase involved in chromosome partitioning or flagellar assembly|nr:hypothetical protein [Haloplasmataceae bacterium]
MNNKIYIIVGHYGSGKSEFSVNFSKYLLSKNLEVCLADLDIVNPYFRSREVREQLTKLGIVVISDTLNSTKGLDMPYLSPAIQGQIALSKKTIILDCGGDDVGIKVLKQFYHEIIKRDYEMLMIINTYRPQTSNVSQIIAMKDKLEAESGLKITGYINNSNFLRQTTIDDVMNANNIIIEVSKDTNIPIKYVSGIKKIIENLPIEAIGDRLMLDLLLRNDWL